MRPKHDNHLLSVIVPVYNCKTIYGDILFLKKTLNHINRPYEIICVIDGLSSRRDKTFHNAIKLRSKNIKIYKYKVNKGKGYAVRFGMARSRGGVVVFIDSGGDLHAKGIGLALEHLRWYNADIIIGSKRHSASKVYYPWQRKILSFVVQRVTKLFFGLNVTDTQTGLKVFKRKVLVKILPRLLVKRWAFDLEMLAVANSLGFNKIHESPIEINHNFVSNIGPSAVLNFAQDFFAIFYRIYLLHYYDDKYKDRWEGDPNLKLRYR